MALWRREEEEEEEGFWLDPSYPRDSTQNGLDEAWRLIGEEEEERRSSKNEPPGLSKSKSKGSRIRSGLKKVAAKQLAWPGSVFLSSLFRLGRSKKSSNGAASSSAESAESSTGRDSPGLVRDSAASASSSSTSCTSGSGGGESSFDADSPTSSVAVASFLALGKDSPPGSMIVVKEVREVEQRFVDGVSKREKEHRRRSSGLPMGLCFPVLWV